MVMTVTQESLIQEAIPALFRNPVTIAEYGSLQTDETAVKELDALMQGGPVPALAAQIAVIVVKLAQADPRKVSKAPTWFGGITGQAIEAKVVYEAARRDLDGLIASAAAAAQAVRDALGLMDRLMESQEAEAAQLQIHIDAGRQFLSSNPEVGVPAAGAGVEFDRPRERFARRLANLATLQSSQAMSVIQLRLTKANAVDMLDRFRETTDVLVPLWRQHTLNLTNTKNMSPAMVAEATKAHEALVRGLAQSLAPVGTV